MISNLEKYKKDLDELIKEGELLHWAIFFEQYPEEKQKFKKRLKGKFTSFEKNLPDFSEKYQLWYSEALILLKQLLPDRVQDFVKLYEKPKTKRKDITYENYTIEDALQGLQVTHHDYLEGTKVIADAKAAIPKFKQQLNIVKAVKRRFESSLFDIKQLVQADLFGSELDAARELNKKGFTRGAGAVAGVVIEGHLAQVCENHKIKVRKKNPTINDFNQLLKDNNVVEMKDWRFIQHLADLRNLCDHKKKKEPTKEDIEELINGVEKIAKTIF